MPTGFPIHYQTLFVMNLAKRQVQIAQISCQMNGKVLAQIARNLTDSEDGLAKLASCQCGRERCPEGVVAASWGIVHRPAVFS